MTVFLPFSILQLLKALPLYIPPSSVQGTPFGGSLPLWSIIGSTPPPPRDQVQNEQKYSYFSNKNQKFNIQLSCTLYINISILQSTQVQNEQTDKQTCAIFFKLDTENLIYSYCVLIFNLFYNINNFVY